MLNVPMHIGFNKKSFQIWMASPMMADFGDHAFVKKKLFCNSILREANLFKWIL